MAHKIEISATLIQGINAVWGQIAADALEFGDELDNEGAIELCYDADRLWTFGYKEADAEIKQLFKKHDIDAVRRALAKKVNLV